MFRIKFNTWDFESSKKVKVVKELVGNIITETPGQIRFRPLNETHYYVINKSKIVSLETIENA